MTTPEELDLPQFVVVTHKPWGRRGRSHRIRYMSGLKENVPPGEDPDEYLRQLIPTIIAEHREDFSPEWALYEVNVTCLARSPKEETDDDNNAEN